MQNSVEEKQFHSFQWQRTKEKKYIWNDMLQEVCLDFGPYVKPRWKEHSGSNHQAILPRCM